MHKKEENSSTYLSEAKNYKTMSPEKQKELFNFIIYSIAQNTKIPFNKFIFLPHVYITVIIEFLLVYIFSEDKIILDVFMQSILYITPTVIILFKLTTRRKEHSI